jgi:hypothetical protein
MIPSIVSVERILFEYNAVKETPRASDREIVLPGWERGGAGEALRLLIGSLAGF